MVDEERNHGIENARIADPAMCEFGKNPELPSPKRKKARDTADNRRNRLLLTIW